MFIKNADHDGDDRAVIEAIVRLDRHKQLQAEFVSSQAVLDTVRELGADYGQGFPLHVPEPLDKLVR